MIATGAQPGSPRAALLRPETRLVVTARARGNGALDTPRLDPPPPDLSHGQLEALLSDAKYPDNLWLVGGEPTLNAELPRLLGALRGQAAQAGAASSRVGLVTDGLALADEAALQPLLSAGLSDVRVQLHAARLDAHDFLVQRKGAARRALQALKLLQRLGVRCEISTQLARVNASALADLVELAAELGVRVLRVERLRLPYSSREQAITLLLRLPLAEPALELAAAKASSLGVHLEVSGFPHCFLGRAAPLAAPSDGVQYLIDAAWPRAAWQPDATVAQRCDGCSDGCQGAGADYVERFGPTELFSARPASGEPKVAAPAGLGTPSTAASASVSGPTPVAAPPPRGARLPTVRLRVVREQAARGDLGGDPVAGPGNRRAEPTLRFGWRGAAPLACESCRSVERPSEVETTRAIRQRLVRAAQYGARVLRVAGTELLSHPGALELIEELPRLSIERVELGLVFGGGSEDVLPTQAFPAFAGLSRVDIALFGSDTTAHDAHVGAAGAFARSLEGVRQLSAQGVPADCFAVLHGAQPVLGFDAAWASGRLPGAPNFRLAEARGSLDELADVLDRLQPAAQRALASLLPACLCEAAGSGPTPGSATFLERAESNLSVSSADRVGRFLPCQCGPERAERCPGVAAGWTARRLQVQP
jgi:MoaA/NifB/PqqE/SkfB family radical SAM enzyme